MQDLYEYLSSKNYPGRGIVIGQNEAGEMLAAYFIMGRSANSRNRIFVKTEDGIHTEAADPSKMEDPSLIIYAPVRRRKDAIVITNGDQTDSIMEGLDQGRTFEQALSTRTFEPDAPSNTPRISCLADKNGYCLSILKSEADGIHCTRQFFHYEWMKGTGHIIHTYVDDGSPLPSFQGEPVLVRLTEDLDAFTKKLWGCLDPLNKISLYTISCRRNGAGREERIWNQYERK